MDELRLQPVGYVKPDITNTHRMPVTGIRSSIMVHSRYQAALPVIAFILSFAWGRYPVAPDEPLTVLMAKITGDGETGIFYRVA